MAWFATDNAACYDGDISITSLVQEDIFELGKRYSVIFTIKSIGQGGLKLESLSGKPVYTEPGTYYYNGTAIQNSLQFSPQTILKNVFEGCIADIYAGEVPFYKIINSSDEIVFEMTSFNLVESIGGHLTYQVDWSNLPNDTYRIVFEDGIINYESVCLCLKSDVCKTILLSWHNESDAYEFNYTDFRPVLRVEGKVWKPSYTKDKEVFTDNSGTRFIVSSRASKRRVLSIERVPEYIHDAIAIGLEHDHFYINGQEYVNEEDDYAPAWVNSSNLSPVEIEVFIKKQDLKNSRCGGTLE